MIDLTKTVIFHARIIDLARTMNDWIENHRFD